MGGVLDTYKIPFILENRERAAVEKRSMDEDASFRSFDVGVGLNCSFALMAHPKGQSIFLLSLTTYPASLSNRRKDG